MDFAPATLIASPQTTQFITTVSLVFRVATVLAQPNFSSFFALVWFIGFLNSAGRSGNGWTDCSTDELPA